METNKMNFDMKTGERLRVTQKYVSVFQEDGGVRYYSLKGKLLNQFSKEQLETELKSTWICMPNCIVTKKGEYWYVITYEGERLCNFEASTVCKYGNYVFVEETKGTRLYDTIKKNFIGEFYDEVLNIGEMFVLKKGEKYYLYNTKTNRIEKEFDFYIKYSKVISELKNPLIGFFVLYNNNKCGLYFLKEGRIFTEIFPVEYQQINLVDKNEIQTLKDGVIKRYLAGTLIKEKSKPNINQISEKNVREKEIYQIEFLNKVKVETGEELTAHNKFFSVLRKDNKSCKYYNLKGKYLGESSCLLYEDGSFWSRNCIATEKMIALGNGGNDPDGWPGYWHIYDYDGNKIFENSFEEAVTGVYENVFYEFCENNHDKNLCAVFSKNGELLLSSNEFKEIRVRNNYFICINYEDKVMFLDKKGCAIFNKTFELENIKVFEVFVIVKDKYEYIVYNCKNERKYYIEADLIEDDAYYGENFKIHRNGKCGNIILDTEGYTIVVPIEYFDVERIGKFILAKAENGDDIYNLQGKIIYSTRKNI